MILSMFINMIKDCRALKNRARSSYRTLGPLTEHSQELAVARNDTSGFSLLEMTVVLIIISILTTAVIPQLIRQYTVNAANKVALDMSAIEEAGRVYYIANNSWPASVAALQTANYLPSSWNGINPFGYSAATPSTYNYNISSTTSLLTVNTYVPVAAQPIIQNLLPVTAVSGNTIYSSVPVPGGAAGGFGIWVAESVGTTYQPQRMDLW